MTKTGWTLQDKIVLVTGGARGIGAAGAAELARRGATVVLADVDETALKEAAQRIPNSSAILFDVTDYDACATAVANVVSEYGRLDIVWANAGIGGGGPSELMEPADWARVIEVNLLGAYNTVRAALASIIDAKGYVAITASLASFAHAPGLSAYAASKAGIEAFANSLRCEVAHQGVDVATLHPTWIDTDMVREGDAESRAFRRFRASLRGPIKKTYPVESIVGPIADAFVERRARIYLPGFVRFAHAMRALLNTAPLTRDQRNAVPEMRALFAEQAAAEGAHTAAMGRRWSR